MRCTMLYVVEAVCFTCRRSRFSSAPSQALSVTCMAGGCHTSQQTELHPVPSRTRSPEPRAAEHANAVALGPGLGTLGPSSPLWSPGLGSHCFLPEAACFPTQFRHGHSGLTLQQVLALYVYMHTHASHSVPSASCQVLLSLRSPCPTPPPEHGSLGIKGWQFLLVFLEGNGLHGSVALLVHHMLFVHLVLFLNFI